MRREGSTLAVSTPIEHRTTAAATATTTRLPLCALKERTSKDGILTHLSLQIKPVQKQTRAGQRTRFKAVVVIGDSAGHVGLGIKTSKEVATAIRAAIIIAKLAVVPIRRGYWGSNLGEPHSIPVKESGKCGSVTVRVSYFFPLFSPLYTPSNISL
jgi:ribosomal protein uS5